MNNPTAWPSNTLVLALIALGVGVAAAAAAGCSHAPPPAPAPVARTAVVGASSSARSTAMTTTARALVPAPPSDASKSNKELAVYFDFDSALLRDDARPVLQKVASIARARDASVRIEGNCDEVGTVEYNIALGEHRAMQAKDYLAHLGVAPAKIQTVSYGAQRPKAAGHDDAAHAQNRRDDFIVR